MLYDQHFYLALVKVYEIYPFAYMLYALHLFLKLQVRIEKLAININSLKRNDIIISSYY